MRRFGRRANFTEGIIIEENEESEEIAEIDEEEDLTRDNQNDFGHMRGFTKFLQGNHMDVTKAHLLKKSKEVDPAKSHFTVANLIFL